MSGFPGLVEYPSRCIKCEEWIISGEKHECKGSIKDRLDRIEALLSEINDRLPSSPKDFGDWLNKQ